MDSVTHYTSSRLFCIWRWLYAAVLIAFAIPFITVQSLDWSADIGYYILFLGGAPAVVYLLLRHVGLTKWSGLFAYAWDATVLAVFVVALILLPNYWGLSFLLPTAGFVCEGVILTMLYFLSRRSTITD